MEEVSHWPLSLWTVYPPECKGMCLLILYHLHEVPDNCCHGYGTTHWLLFLNIVCLHFAVLSGLLWIMVLVQESEWHIVIMLVCKGYFKCVLCLK